MDTKHSIHRTKTELPAPILPLFDDSLLIRLSRMEEFPIAAQTHPWIAGISLIVWLLIGYPALNGDLSFSTDTFLVILLAASIFIASWIIAESRDRQIRRAFRLLNSCRKQLLYIAGYLAASLQNLDKHLAKLRKKEYLLPQDRIRDHYMLVDIKNAIEERSFKVRELLLSGSRKDLQLALRILKMPYLVRQSAGSGFQMAIPLETLTATALTLIQGIETELDGVLFRDQGRVG